MAFVGALGGIVVYGPLLVETLTNHQRNIIGLSALGLYDSDIARILRRAYGTIKNVHTAAYARLRLDNADASNRTRAALMYYEWAMRGYTDAEYHHQGDRRDPGIRAESGDIQHRHMA